LCAASVTGPVAVTGEAVASTVGDALAEALSEAWALGEAEALADADADADALAEALADGVGVALVDTGCFVGRCVAFAVGALVGVGFVTTGFAGETLGAVMDRVACQTRATESPGCTLRSSMPTLAEAQPAP